MRQIRYTTRRLTMDLLTSVLDPARLTAEEALDCYRLRWQVERLFFDLKEVLDLRHFYLASPQGVAQQVYAAAAVYAAMRVAQARTAQEHRLSPEELSPAKLFPRVARVSIVIVDAELAFAATQRANPRVRLTKPDWAELPRCKFHYGRCWLNGVEASVVSVGTVQVAVDGNRSRISPAHVSSSYLRCARQCCSLAGASPASPTEYGL